MGELAARPAHLPDALVRLLPVVDHEVDQVPSQCPRFVVQRADAELARQVERVEHLAVYVELELRGGRVADPNRTRVLITGQPVDLELR